MKHTLENLQPTALWAHFFKLAECPRPSLKEGKVKEYIKRCAHEVGAQWREDQAGNLIVKRQGSLKSPSIAFQGHMDMVCEKHAHVEHDFDKDPIKLRFDAEKPYLLKADGTTLGADNGLGVATMLAVMMDTRLKTGPLEFLFTVDEERGLFGALGLENGVLESTILLNLDTEESGSVYVGCSGGINADIALPVDWTSGEAGGQAFLLKVKGLQGGHSGVDIHKGRAHSVPLMASLLDELKQKISYQLVDVRAGKGRNAIAREGEALLWVSPKDVDSLGMEVDALQKKIHSIFEHRDPHLQVTVERGTVSSPKALTHESFERILSLISSLPQGPLVWAPHIQDLVRTSNNIGSMALEQKTFQLKLKARSSHENEFDLLIGRIKKIAQGFGAEINFNGRYPGWEPDLKSPLLRRTLDVGQKIYGKEMNVKAIHAGLECGIIGGKHPHMRMISFGPDIHDAHSPDESVDVRGVPLFWDMVKTLLEDLCQKPL